jgi:HEPN domain-containing protein
MAESNFVIREWIAKAEGDWRVLMLASEREGMKDAVLFHAQQCAEKYLKAALIAHGVTVQKTHVLLDLSVQLSTFDPGWQADPDAMERLTQGGVTFRYPGFDASEADACFAVEQAGDIRQRLRAWLNSLPEATA